MRIKRKTVNVINYYIIIIINDEVKRKNNKFIIRPIILLNNQIFLQPQLKNTPNPC